MPAKLQNLIPNKPNLNKRIYPLDILIDAINDFKKNSVCIVEIHDENKSASINLSNAAAKITDMYANSEGVFIEFSILPYTVYGKMLQSLINDKKEPKFYLKSLGIVDPITKIIDRKDFRILSVTWSS